MPLIEVKYFDQEITDTERSEIIRAVTDAMVSFTGKPRRRRRDTRPGSAGEIAGPAPSSAGELAARCLRLHSGETQSHPFARPKQDANSGAPSRP